MGSTEFGCRVVPILFALGILEVEGVPYGWVW